MVFHPQVGSGETPVSSCIWISLHRVRPARNVRCQGMTLPELLVAMAAASTLLVGLGSTLYLVSQTTGTSRRPATDVVDASLTLDQLAAELQYAVSFPERSPTTVEFTLADRTHDALPETVRYTWSGAAGDPLYRQFNGGPLTAVIDDVQAFNLSYSLQTVIEQPESSDSSGDAGTEELAVQFDGWSGISATPMTFTFDADRWVGQYYELWWPAEATQFQVSRVRLKLWKGSDSGQFTVGIYKAAATGPYPEGSALGSELTVSTADLPSSADWHEFQFSDVTLDDPSSGYLVVVKGLISGFYLQYLRATSAPADSTSYQHSTNGGATWFPPSVYRNWYDAPVEIYGMFNGSESEPPPDPVERHFVRSVNVALQTGESPTNRVQTAVNILNSPEVSGP